jgi:hypothetical protein
MLASVLTREGDPTAIPSLKSSMRTVRIERELLHVLHLDSVKSTLTANCQGSFDLSEQSSISVGIFHARRPEKVDTGGGAAMNAPCSEGSVYCRVFRATSRRRSMCARAEQALGGSRILKSRGSQKRQRAAGDRV